MRYLSILSFALISACSASPKAGDKLVDKPAAAPLTPYEQEWLEYREGTALPTVIPLEPAVFQDALGRKLTALKEQEANYADLRASDLLEAQAQGEYASGRIYLNLGCELVTFEAPVDFTEQQAAVWNQQVFRLAAPMFEKAQKHLNASAQMGAGPASEAALGVVGQWGGTPQELCAATSSTWEPLNRPEAQVASADECVARARKEFVVPRGCYDHVADACRAGTADVCHAGGHYAYEHKTRADAHDLWTRACAFGQKGACGALTLFTVEAGRASSAAACKGGDVLGCIRLARLADADGEAAKACTAESAFKDKAASLDKCQAGDVSACWALVAKQLRAAPMPPIEGVGGILGSLFGAVAEPDKKAELQANCDQGKAIDCLFAADLEEGEAKLPWLEKACEGKVGCSKLGFALVETGKDITRGTRLLVSGCVEEGLMCLDAAGLFSEKSTACSAALALHNCAPDDPFSCTEVNLLFHPAKK